MAAGEECPAKHVINLGGTSVEQDRAAQCSSVGNEPQYLWLKKRVRVLAGGETPGLMGEFLRESHGDLECTENHPPRNQHQKGPRYLWIAEEGTER